MAFHSYLVSLYGQYGDLMYKALLILFYLYPIWLPLLLGILFWIVWMRYIRYNFFVSTPTVLLEIRLPKEITQSPAAMELALNAMYTTSSESTFVDRYWLGKTRAWFSLEIVSFSGEIHFYIWTRSNVRNFVEAALYSQFPEIEVTEVEDYAKKFVFDPAKNAMWATNYKLSNPDPLPLRTYVDYGLDKDPKPEFAIDPITPMLEFLGSLKPGENIWIQYVIRAHKKEKRGGFFSDPSSWAAQVDKLRSRFIKMVKENGRITLTDDESRVLDALNRSIIKYSFDVGIRGMYITDTPQLFNGGLPSFFRGHIFRPYSAQFGIDIGATKADGKEETKYYAGFNSLAITKSTDTDYPWQDFFGVRMNRAKRLHLDAYKRRMFFYPPYEEPTMVMTTETIASLYHFPGSYAATPGLVRIPSKRGQAPANLPV